MTRSRPIRDALMHMVRLALPRPAAPVVDMTGRRVIVTGASTGSIGYFVAKTLAAWGADVVVTRRHRSESLEADLRRDVARFAPGRLIHARTLDLADAESVEAFADWYRNNHDGLDVLVNNAGILLDVFSRWSEPRRSLDGFEIHWRTNFLGTVHLTRALLPLLMASGQESRDARVINVVSQQHIRGRNAWFLATPLHYSSWTAYGQSKLGLVHHSFELNRRYAHQYDVRSAAVHPGTAYTNMIRDGIFGLPGPAWLHRLIARTAAGLLMTPEQCAQTIILCASDPELQGGRYHERCAVAQHSNEANDLDAASRLWERTMQWIP